MQKILSKIVAGSKYRKTRLHDEKGNRVCFKNFMFSAPKALFTWFLRLFFGYRLSLPWIPFTVISIFKKFLTSKSRVLEFGSGMSTIWFAKHAGEVYSMEDFLPWYEKVKNLLEKNNLKNVQYSFSEKDDYYTFMAGSSLHFDLIMIDGKHRDKCLSNAFKLLGPGGLLYLDDSDKDLPWPESEFRKAEKLIREFAKEKSGSISYFTDFFPGYFFVKQGMMIKLPE